ncbi:MULTISPECIES: tape measure protein [unclassified Sphingobium]|uniref:tape measure protein n=1 Tax=unclassified Sphingobium TaxID=2611147 RepID=UPI0035A65E67
MKLSLILEAVDRMTRPARQAAAGVKELTDKAKPAAKAVEATARAVDKMTRPARQAAAGVKDLTDRAKQATRSVGDVDRQVTRVSADFIKWTRAALRTADALDRVADRGRALGRAGLLSAKWVGLKSIEIGAIGAGKGLRFAATKAKELALWSVRWGAAGIAAGSAAALAWLVTGTIRTGSQFEQFQAQLEGTEGSVEKAKKALAWVAKFARDTPYELEEVTDAFARARGVGIDPMSGAMKNMGDAASGARKDLMSAIEAVADAQTGEFERLKEFNITTSVKGDKVTFAYINKAGKDAERTVGKSMASIRQAVLSIFDEKYGGSMIRRSKTFEGIWSNIKDKLSGIQLRIANAGFFDKIKGKLQDLLDWLDKMEANGSLERWAKQISDQLGEMVDTAVEFAKSVPWRDVADGMMAVATAATEAAAFIGRAARAYSEWRYTVARENLTRRLDGWFVGDEERGRIRQQIDQLDREYGGKKDKPYNGPQLRGGLRGERTGRPDNSTWMRGLNERPRLAPAVPRPSAGTRAPLKPAAPAAKGEIKLHVTTDKGVSVRPTKVAATNLDLEVNTGRAMGGFA